MDSRVISKAKFSSCYVAANKMAMVTRVAELKYVTMDMLEAGSIPLLMKAMQGRGYLHADCLTVTGRTLAENVDHVAGSEHQDVVRPADKPIIATGDDVGLRGNLASGGAFWKYGQSVRSARHGAVMHPGEVKETRCYADI